MAGVIVLNVVNVPISGGLEKYCCFDVWFMSLYQSKQCDFVCDLPLPDTHLKHSVYIFVPPCVLCIYNSFILMHYFFMWFHTFLKGCWISKFFFIFLFSQWLWYFTCVRERERFWLHLQHFWLNLCQLLLASLADTHLRVSWLWPLSRSTRAICCDYILTYFLRP